MNELILLSSLAENTNLKAHWWSQCETETLLVSLLHSLVNFQKPCSFNPEGCAREFTGIIFYIWHGMARDQTYECHSWGRCSTSILYRVGRLALNLQTLYYRRIIRDVSVVTVTTWQNSPTSSNDTQWDTHRRAASVKSATRSTRYLFCFQYWICR